MELKRFHYFLMVGDAHLGCAFADVEALYTFANAVKEVFARLPTKPIAVVDAGDILDSPQHSTLRGMYRRVMDFSSLGIPSIVTLGNHDVKGLSTHEFLEVVGESVRKVDVRVSQGYVRFVSICTARPDNVLGSVSDEELDAAEELVSECEQDEKCVCCYILAHHPPSVTDGPAAYRVTPFSDVACGDVTRLINMVDNYSKLSAYLYGHVHVNWVTYSAYGKPYISVAPLTMDGPWTKVWGWEPYDGVGKAYRIVAWVDGRVYTRVFRVGEWPIALVMQREKELLILALSDTDIVKVEVCAGGERYSAEPIAAVNHGGVYTVNTAMHAGKVTVRVLDILGREYIAEYLVRQPTEHAKFEKRGNVAVLPGVRENVPVTRICMARDKSMKVAIVKVGNGRRVVAKICFEKAREGEKALAILALTENDIGIVRDTRELLQQLTLEAAIEIAKGSIKALVTAKGKCLSQTQTYARNFHELIIELMGKSAKAIVQGPSTRVETETEVPVGDVEAAFIVASEPRHAGEVALHRIELSGPRSSLES